MISGFKMELDDGVYTHYTWDKKYELYRNDDTGLTYLYIPKDAILD